MLHRPPRIAAACLSLATLLLAAPAALAKPMPLHEAEIIELRWSCTNGVFSHGPATFGTVNVRESARQPVGTVRLRLSGALPSTTFAARYSEDFGLFGCETHTIGTLTTDASGNASGTFDYRAVSNRQDSNFLLAQVVGGVVSDSGIGYGTEPIAR